MNHQIKGIISIILIFLSILFSSKVYCQSQTSSIYSFEPDLKIFTLHAFMNAAGLNAEWRKKGMHPLRIKIREELKNTLDSNFVKKVKDYRKKTDNYSWTGWARYGLVTKGPPNFDLTYDSHSTDIEDIESQFPNLSPLLAEFYQKASIQKLWESYLPKLDSINAEFKPYAEKALNDIVNYCRLDESYFKKNTSKIHVQFSPLMLYYTAQKVVVNGELWLIFGPQESEPSAASYYHEALHEVVDPITEKNEKSLTRLNELFELTKDMESSYEIVNESFVRTLSKVLAGKLFGESNKQIHKNILAEYKLGFMLCPVIYEALSEYENSNISFSEFYSKVIESIDITKEKKRWEQLKESE
jgi:hypothetical protein